MWSPRPLLTAWKRTEELAFLNEVSSVPLQQALRHLQAAFANFFAKRAKYPTFKSQKKSRASAEYTRSAFTLRDGPLTLAKMDEPLDIVWSRPLPEGAEPSTVTVSKDAAGRWFVSILCEDTIRATAPGTRRGGRGRGDHVAGHPVDRARRSPTRGMSGATGSRLAKAQRELARKDKGSANRAEGQAEGRPRPCADRRPAAGPPAQADHSARP